MLCSSQPKPNTNKLIEKLLISDVFERLFSKKVTFKMCYILNTRRKKLLGDGVSGNTYPEMNHGFIDITT